MKNDVYGEPVVYETENAIVRVYRPILTDSERKVRRKAINDAAVNLLKQVERLNEKII